MWVLRLGMGSRELFFGPFHTKAQTERYLKLCSTQEHEVSEVIPAACPDCMGVMRDCGCEPR